MQCWRSTWLSGFKICSSRSTWFNVQAKCPLQSSLRKRGFRQPDLCNQIVLIRPKGLLKQFEDLPRASRLISA